MSAGLALSLAALALLEVTGSAPPALFNVATVLVGVMSAGLVLGTGAWCFTLAHSRRVDPTTPQLSPVWFLVAWFLPIVHILVPHRMFGDLWASAKWQQSDRRGSNTPLAPRPRVITLWACTSGLLFALGILGFLRDAGTTMLAVNLGLSAASVCLLGAVVRAIAHELGQ